jgi:hypothetical protein
VKLPIVWVLIIQLILPVFSERKQGLPLQYTETNNYTNDIMNNEIKRITVFCGSSFGTESVYEEQAYELGKYWYRIL